MGFFRRLMFYYFLRRSRYSPILLAPVPNQVFSEPGPYPGAPQRVRVAHGSRWEAFKYFVRYARWWVEYRVDRLMGFPEPRAEYAVLRTVVREIERERKQCGR